MGLIDLIIAPIYIMLFTVVALFVRPYFTNEKTKKFFLPALWGKYVGAIGLGLIYQLYYGGGDTFNYWNNACVIIDRIIEDPLSGFSLIYDPESNPSNFLLLSKLWLFQSDSAFAMVRITTILGLFSFRSYAGASIILSSFVFLSSWLMYSSLTRIYSKATNSLACAILFLPSIIFWGSGILKDSVVLGCVFIIIWVFIDFFEFKKVRPHKIILLVFSLYIVYLVKIYVLITLMPSIVFWLYLKNINAIRSLAVKLLIAPILVILFISISYFVALKIGEGNSRYSLEEIPKWSQITAYDIAYWTGKDAGSTYSLGDHDGTWNSMLRIAPNAIITSIFRPYPWEVNNILMAFSSIESFVFLLLYLTLVIKSKWNILWFKNHSILSFFILFTIVFGFAVGSSTFNFGSMVRYRIPMLPLFASTIAIGWSYINKFDVGFLKTKK
ncbi:hypothetical protein [Ekhidna sp.]